MHLTVHQLTARVTGALSGASLQLVELHLERCETCRSSLAMFDLQDAALAQVLADEPGDAFFEELLVEAAGCIDEPMARRMAALIAARPRPVSEGVAGAPEPAPAAVELDPHALSQAEARTRELVAALEAAEAVPPPTPPAARSTAQAPTPPPAPVATSEATAPPVLAAPPAPMPLAPPPAPVATPVPVPKAPAIIATPSAPPPDPPQAPVAAMPSTPPHALPPAPVATPVPAPPPAPVAPLVPEPAAAGSPGADEDAPGARRRPARAPRPAAPRRRTMNVAGMAAAIAVAAALVTVMATMFMMGRLSRENGPAMTTGAPMQPAVAPMQPASPSTPRVTPADAPAPATPVVTAVPRTVAPRRVPAPAPRVKAPAEDAPPHEPPARDAGAPAVSAPAAPAPSSTRTSEPAPPRGLLCGSVYDGDSRPVPSATVTLAEFGVTVHTDRAGRFCLSVPVGVRTIVVVGAGYRPLRVSVEVSSDTPELGLTLRAATATPGDSSAR